MAASRSNAAISLPEVVLLDEVVDQPIAQVNQLFEPISGTGVVLLRHLDIHPESEGNHIVGRVVTEKFALDAILHDVAV